ncbi:hypothetical protein LV457_01720 [Mycobacterium sp. MYCO198283]|uniref:hypothetical protein n=1 Tax=Mycobacterium sp. MYCO198283 TaxID=2883505 RepID=UPI001E65BA3B|nr:hypothetical protein [Mycobacterium sp. MYCO198283]MCG5431016.1 hypothetical protein [Mycobacterium sp. MYCO198283]
MNPWDQGGPPPHQGSWQPGGWQAPEPRHTGYPYGPPPAYPYGPPPGYPYGPPNPPASGATAIVAAVLSFLGALANVLSAVDGFVSVASLREPRGAYGVEYPAWLAPTGIIVSIAQLVLAVALVFGGVQLVRRRLNGRVVVAAAAGAAVLIQLVSLGFAAAAVKWARDLSARYDVGVDLGPLLTLSIGISAVMIIFPIATGVLALLPATRRWCLSAPPSPGPPFGRY